MLPMAMHTGEATPTPGTVAIRRSHRAPGGKRRGDVPSDAVPEREAMHIVRLGRQKEDSAGGDSRFLGILARPELLPGIPSECPRFEAAVPSKRRRTS